jgi:hypothetical protein
MPKIVLLLLCSGLLWASPLDRMNRAFDALLELLPYLTDKQRFVEKENEAAITKNLAALEKNFTGVKHDSILKSDVFAPSLDLIKENLRQSREAFSQGRKDYAWWRLGTVTTQCLSCHTALPPSHASSFSARGLDAKRFGSSYDLGIGQLLVRQYPEARASFRQDIAERIQRRAFSDILLPLKQLLLIHTKVEKDPAGMLAAIDEFKPRLVLTKAEEEILRSWYERLGAWKSGVPWGRDRLGSDSELRTFIDKVLRPLFRQDSVYIGKFDVDLLIASGMLGNYLVEYPASKLAPEALFWLGMSEKVLRRENFFSNGELMLRNCVTKYPKHPVARRCLEEYQESVEFGFTGSRGTELPPEVKKELETLRGKLPK